MAGKSWQPSHEAPLVTLLKQWKEGEKGVGGNCPGDELPHYKNARKHLLYVHHATIHEHVEFQHMHLCVDTTYY